MDSSSNTNNNENIQREVVGKKRGGSQKRSWVWEWFISDGAAATCQVECSNGEICSKHYQHGSSTGILIDHLLKAHQIIKGLTKQDYVVNKFILIFF